MKNLFYALLCSALVCVVTIAFVMFFNENIKIPTPKPAPCSQYNDASLQGIPARCLSHFIYADPQE